MTDDALALLPAEVREARSRIARALVACNAEIAADFNLVGAELLRLAGRAELYDHMLGVVKAAGFDSVTESLAALSRAEAERDALRARIETAPVGKPVEVDFDKMTVTVAIDKGYKTNGARVAMVVLNKAESTQ